MGDGHAEPADSDEQAQQKLVSREAARIRPIAEEASKIGCAVGLYNHGGWFGEPEHQLAILRALDLPNVGIVYNLHHGHHHLDRFANILAKIKPHLLCLNLNGMTRGGDANGQAILPIGAGELDLQLLQTILDSGYQGPIGILNHTDLDAAARLQDNLDGLSWLCGRIRGDTHASRPVYRTWPPMTNEESKQVDQLLSDANELGNAERGLSVFSSLTTSCFSCHKIASHGGTIGPELTGIARQRTPQQIAQSLLWPNRVVEDKYRATIVERLDGTSVRGYVVRHDEQTITLKDPSDGVEQIIRRDEIDEQRQGNSLMPEELLTALTRQQQADLLRLLLEVGTSERFDLQLADAVLAHAVSHTPQTFPYDRTPLEPKRWPDWQQAVNRDRVYDFYTKQAEYFRTHSHGPLLASAPELDGGKYGHWGNQDEDTWRGGEWNDVQLGSVQCGVFHGDGVQVARAICVRLRDQGDAAVCFDPDMLGYSLLWKGGFLKFSDVRHGFLNGITQSGKTVERFAASPPDEPFVYRGFYRHGNRVIFAYRVGSIEYLNSPRFENGKFIPRVAPRGQDELSRMIAGGQPQWPQTLTTAIHYGNDWPYTIDSIELPVDSRWKAPMFCSGHAFLPDGSALVTTMQGDVWHVSGFAYNGSKPLNQQPRTATWRRFASGLHQPLGIWIDKEGIFVMCRDQLMRLHDLDGDGEADYYECFSHAFETSPAGHDFICGLERDGHGRFYTSSGNQGLVQIAADGKTATVVATGFRNPDGVGLYPDDVATVPCSEGDWTPASMICAVRCPPADAVSSSATPHQYFGHGGPRDGVAPQLPMVYLPRLLDNSSGGQIYVSSDRWGPLKGQLIHFSYGAGSHFLILRDEVDGQLQGAVVPLPGSFAAGSHRGRFSPVDGQLYVTGMGGWGTYTPAVGCFERVRYVGGPVQLPVGIHVYENGVAVTFTQSIDTSIAENTQSHFAQVWNYRYSAAYGSPEYSTGHVGVIGHDALQIASAHILKDGRTLFLELPELQPVNQLHLRLHVDRGSGHDLFVTVHHLDRPKTDLPGYHASVKQIRPHPIEFDLALATRRTPNPWRDKIAGGASAGDCGGAKPFLHKDYAQCSHRRTACVDNEES